MLTRDFQTFLKTAPTAYHAVSEIKQRLKKEHFLELDEKENWTLSAGGKYFCIREGSLIAFILPLKPMTDALIFASHTDSPALKLKPHAEFIKEGMVMWGVEIYGAPLLSSWLNRDLGIGGKVLYLDRKNQVQEEIIQIENAPCTIPQLAIHLDREVNEKGLVLDKQEHLNALAAVSEKPDYLLSLLKKILPLKELLAHDLFLYPLEDSRVIGNEEALLAGYRLDNLVAVYAILTALLKNKTPLPNTLQMAAFWDHEEIGSNTATGAESPFFSHILERITIALRMSRENYLKILPASLCVSVDLSHSVHPNYVDRHDPLHKPKLGQGVLIKTHAQKRYATDTKSMRMIIETAKKKKIPLSLLSTKNTIPSGSTVGPIQAAATGIPTVDIGIGELSMHSARELIAVKDLTALSDLISALIRQALPEAAPRKSRKKP